jgi:hypothetical protein
VRASGAAKKRWAGAVQAAESSDGGSFSLTRLSVVDGDDRST